MASLKIIELVGLSSQGWGAAARAAVAEATKTVPNVEGLEVLRSTAVVRQGEIVEYQAHVRVTYRVDDAEEPLLAVEAVETILHEPGAGSGEDEVLVVPTERLLEELEGLGEPETRP